MVARSVVVVGVVVLGMVVWGVVVLDMSQTYENIVIHSFVHSFILS